MPISELRDVRAARAGYPSASLSAIPQGCLPLGWEEDLPPGLGFVYLIIYSSGGGSRGAGGAN